MKINESHITALKGAVSLLEKSVFKELDCDAVIDCYGKLFMLKKVIEQMEKELNPPPVTSTPTPSLKKAKKKKAKKDATQSK